MNLGNCVFAKNNVKIYFVPFPFSKIMKDSVSFSLSWRTRNTLGVSLIKYYYLNWSILMDPLFLILINECLTTSSSFLFENQNLGFNNFYLNFIPPSSIFLWGTQEYANHRLRFTVYVVQNLCSTGQYTTFMKNIVVIDWKWIANRCTTTRL